MYPNKSSRAFRHFSKHLFLVGKVYVERKKAHEDVDNHLQKMRKSIIRMTLSYSDADILKEKLDNLINWERKYAKFFKPQDKETQELREQLNVLVAELREEREDKQRIIEENNRKINQLTDSLNNIKSKTNYLLMERAKRHHRLKALENKISEKVDVHRYYHS